MAAETRLTSPSRRARCLDCGDVVESKHRHDFVGCSCGAMFLDGGLDYVRYGCKDSARVELLTEYEPVA